MWLITAINQVLVAYNDGACFYIEYTLYFCGQIDNLCLIFYIDKNQYYYILFGVGHIPCGRGV